MPADEVRAALIVATNEYDDEGLRELRAPAHDAQELARVLGDRAIGNFEVETLINQPQYLVMEQLETFFSDRRRNDLLLLYFSCHGVKDDDGRLHFAATNTKRNRLASTAVPADWVTQQMDRSRSNRVVLMLDCCYSGAFGRGMKGDAVVGVKERFDGRGRVILTASNAIEYSFEGDQVSGTGQPSVFTGALVQGLASGDADVGGDGLIDVDELYDYVYGKVRECTPNQTPGKWALGVEGELYVARSQAPLKPRPLPLELRQAVESPLPSVREGAVKALSQLLAGSHGGLRLSARDMLHQLADHDDSRGVSQAATAALAVDTAPAPTVGDLAIGPSLADLPKPAMVESSDLEAAPPVDRPPSTPKAATPSQDVQDESTRRRRRAATREAARQTRLTQPEPSRGPTPDALPDPPANSPAKDRVVTLRRIAVVCVSLVLAGFLALSVASGGSSGLLATLVLVIVVIVVLVRRQQESHSPSAASGPTLRQPVADSVGDSDQQIPTLQVVALGVAGSGKTVFVASMFHDLSVPSPGRSYFLETDLRQRVSLSSTFRQIASIDEAWPRGTQIGETREFTFDFATLHHGAKHPLIKIRYLDYAGELLEAEQAAGSTTLATLEEHIKGAHSLLGMIDGQRILQYLRGEPEGRDYLQHTIQPMIGVMASAECPIQFVITKWDIVRDFGEREDASDDLRLRIVRHALLTNTQLAALVTGQSREQRIVRMIPVSAVGPGFAEVDSSSRVVKSGRAELTPSNLEIPLSAVLPDFFNKIRSELAAPHQRQIEHHSRGLLQLSSQGRLGAMTKFARLPAGMALRSNIAAAFGTKQVENMVGAFLAWTSKQSDTSVPSIEEDEAAGKEQQSVVEQLRSTIMKEMDSTLSVFEEHCPASVLTDT